MGICSTQKWELIWLPRIKANLKTLKHQIFLLLSDTSTLKATQKAYEEGIIALH